MENNVVELKFDRVNEYFEKFKKEYDAEYERNKTSGTRTIVPYHMLIRPAVASGMGLIVVFMAHYGFSNIPKINSNDISGSLSHMIEILSSWVIPAMALVLIASFLINFVRMMAHSYETTNITERLSQECLISYVLNYTIQLQKICSFLIKLV